MSTKAVQDRNDESVSFSQKISDVLVKNRIIIVSALAVLFCVIGGMVALTLFNDSRNSAAFAAVDTIVGDWQEARNAADKTGLAAKEDGYLASLAGVSAKNRSSYAGARAYQSAAEIYFSRKDWKNAQDNYLAAAKADSKAYTAGIGYYNAAVCADELGNQAEAVEYFNKALSFDSFKLKSRALFNIGRIEEQRTNRDAAIAAYEKLAEQYPDDEWTLLAKSRIIALQVK